MLWLIGWMDGMLWLIGWMDGMLWLIGWMDGMLWLIGWMDGMLWLIGRMGQQEEKGRCEKSVEMYKTLYTEVVSMTVIICCFCYFLLRMGLR